eukprot:TRINITY_DN40842_c0_g1_i1.p1 TRINITY_DN40842_c0_g1~~TRINITY_DN40842_c0_g1_i1.p1  ORF type:complete len:323 (-),score=54.47 TRINITY_DN40842_c0_g1_i1:73-1041(-)
MLTYCMAILLIGCVANKNISLAAFDSFDGSVKLKWEQETDDVMGGSSNGSFTHHGKSNIFQGECNTLPAPRTAGWFSVAANLSPAPLNGCQGIAITARTNLPYLGFRLSFGTDKWYSKEGYKAVFTVPTGKEFTSVQIPWEDFTRAWDDATGKPEMACAHDTSVCPTFVQLQNIQKLKLWAEGVAGPFHLEVESISAYSCSTVQTKPHWNIKTACEQVCQPDPEYSKTDWCKHKDRGGCCVGVNPSWDDTPGYKHMSDFCDKLCMPDGPGKLAMCQPPAEYAVLEAIDPLDAIDKFYGKHPEQCKNRIGDWAEPNCRVSLFA